MPQIVAVSNLKGGVGKSTLAVNVACALAERRRVQLVDADGQATAADWLTSPVANMAVLPLPLEAETERGIAQWTARVRELDADIVIIDCPPHLSAVTGAALGLADLVLLPCGPSVADVRATARTVELIRAARKVRRGKPAALVIPNRIDRRSATGRGIAVALGALDERVGPALVARQAHADATGSGTWVGEYAHGSPADAEIAAVATAVEQALKG